MTCPQDKLDDTQVEKLREYYQAIFKYLDELKAESLDSTDSANSPAGQLSEKSPGLGFASLRSKIGNKVKKEDSVATAPTEKLTRAEFLKVLFGVIQWDHPDSIFLRSLRARKWDIPAALKMMTTAIRWFHAVDIASIKLLGEAKINMDIFKKGECYFQGFDYEGRPVCYINTRLHDPKAMTMEEIQSFTLLVMETSRLLFCGNVETVAIIFDLTDFAMANMDYTTIKFLILVLEKDYPESLGRILILNAPWFFSGIWKIVSAMLDPAVVAKIHFIPTKELTNYIDPSHLSPGLGGTGPSSLPYLDPKPDENILLQDSEGRQKAEAEHKQATLDFETATRAWLADPKAAEQRDKAIASLRQASINLDPYIRARTVYHRLGVIKNIGEVDWSALKSLQ